MDQSSVSTDSLVTMKRSCPDVPEDCSEPPEKRMKDSPAPRSDDEVDSSDALSSELALGLAMPIRRRVNPESLAKRLGDDLVRDLDALIQPGNYDMPSFAARKEIQERHNIDRRHIYDYYHSKGLRVVKEDRFGNPIKSTDATPVLSQIPRRQLRPAPVQTQPLLRALVVPQKRSISKPNVPGQTKGRRGRPRKNFNNCGSDQTPPTLSDEFTPPTPQKFRLVNPLDPVCSSQIICDDFMFDSMTDDLTEDSLGTDNLDMTYDVTPTSLFDWDSSTTASDDEDILPFSLVDHGFLPSGENRDLYTFLSEAIGPACGLQESQGTYKAYMSGRSQAYFTKLLSNSQYVSQRNHILDRRSPAGYKSSTANGLDRDGVDFRKWLVYGTSPLLDAQSSVDYEPTDATPSSTATISKNSPSFPAIPGANTNARCSDAQTRSHYIQPATRSPVIDDARSPFRTLFPEATHLHAGLGASPVLHCSVTVDQSDVNNSNRVPTAVDTRPESDSSKDDKISDRGAHLDLPVAIIPAIMDSSASPATLLRGKLTQHINQLSSKYDYHMPGAASRNDGPSLAQLCKKYSESSGNTRVGGARIRYFMRNAAKPALLEYNPINRVRTTSAGGGI